MNCTIPVEKHLKAEPQIAVVFMSFTHDLDTNYCRGGGSSIAGIGSRDELALPCHHKPHF